MDHVLGPLAYSILTFIPFVKNAEEKWLGLLEGLSSLMLSDGNNIPSEITVSYMTLSPSIAISQ